MAVIVAVISGLITLLPFVYLADKRRGRELRATTQAFTFHAQRDRLRHMVLDGRLSQDSVVYSFLSHSINLMIHNAGEIRLSHAVEISRDISASLHPTVTEEMDGLFKQIEASDPEVRQFAAENLRETAKCLVHNDTHLAFAKFVYQQGRASLGTRIKAALKKLAGAQRVELVRATHDIEDSANKLQGGPLTA